MRLFPSAAWLAYGCALVACQAISGLGGFGLAEGTDASHAAGTGSMAQAGGNGGASSVASGSGGLGPTASSVTTLVTAPASTSTIGSTVTVTASSSSSSSGTGGATACENYVFVTNKLFYGNELVAAQGAGGGLVVNDGADAFCGFEAMASPLPSVLNKPKWAAVYATPAVSAKAHVDAVLMNSPIGKVCLPDGTPVALPGKWWTGTHVAGISQFADGSAANFLVWTGANESGATALDHCLAWTTKSGAKIGVVGGSLDASTWANKENRFCDFQLPVYCISNSK